MNPLLLCFAPSLGGCGGSAGMCVLGGGKKLPVPDRYNCTLRGAYRDYHKKSADMPVPR